VVSVVTLAVCCGSVALATLPLPIDLSHLPTNLHSLNMGMLLVEIAMSLFIVYVGVRAKHLLIVLLALAQGALMVWFELGPGAHLEVAQNLFVDKFSIIMALINGLVGGGICLYALGYMREYHEVAHRDVPDRRPLFFALLFVFMGSMFGLIFANNLVWMFLFWEITTLCSFLLIGYTQTDEAKRNALRALVMNLAGGLAFALAIVFLHRNTGNIELSVLMDKAAHGPFDKTLLLLPAALLCFAGITKSA
jgi:ech hydrogenase subunit A